MTPQQLINKYIQEGGNITRQEPVDKLPEPHPNPIKTESIHYTKTGKRIYYNLGNMSQILPIDITTLNYGD